MEEETPSGRGREMCRNTRAERERVRHTLSRARTHSERKLERDRKNSHCGSNAAEHISAGSCVVVVMLVPHLCFVPVQW